MPSQANEDPNEVKARSQKCERTEHLSFHISANVANLWNDRFRPSEILLSRYTEDSSSAVHDPDGTPYPSMVVPKSETHSFDCWLTSYSVISRAS